MLSGAAQTADTQAKRLAAMAATYVRIAAARDTTSQDSQGPNDGWLYLMTSR